jgi:hypothetical protein
VHVISLSSALSIVSNGAGEGGGGVKRVRVLAYLDNRTAEQFIFFVSATPLPPPKKKILKPCCKALCILYEFRKLSSPQLSRSWKYLKGELGYDTFCYITYKSCLRVGTRTYRYLYVCTYVPVICTGTSTYRNHRRFA